MIVYMVSPKQETEFSLKTTAQWHEEEENTDLAQAKIIILWLLSLWFLSKLP